MSAICSTCGVASAVLVHHELRGKKRVVEWQSCVTCELADQKRWTEQRTDEAREAGERAERSRRAAERDAARNEKKQGAA